ncbi:MAG: GNAT family N-acetyltransferase [Bacteroidetes bacterium]|nr:GNAT family N-acetyltransferase [Bacteroidota bacterium]
MPSSSSIKHLTRTQIDTTRWNDCIEQANNESPYARADYLDALCPGWEALVQGDYQLVMPLPVKRKFGIRYLYQPTLVPHLGVYGKSIDSEQLISFLQSIPKNIRWIDATLNPSNRVEHPDFPIRMRTNYILSLVDEYDTLRSRYRENHRRNLQRAQKAGCTVNTTIDVREIFQLVQNYVIPRPSLSDSTKKSFLLLMENWMQSGRAQTYGVRVNGTLQAGALFLLDRNRAYYLLAGNHPNGKTLGASHALIDAFIQANAGTDRILDFEGSDLPSLAFFYAGFGSKTEPYAWLQWNRLPWWVRWIKSGSASM